MCEEKAKIITGEVVSVNISSEKGVSKKRVAKILLKEDFGVENDAHAKTPNREVSLLALESILKTRKKKLAVNPGDFAENITTKGIDLLQLPLGTRLQIGETILEVTQIGKICHSRCQVFYRVGECVMPKEGIFGRVVRGGEVAVGDMIIVTGDRHSREVL
ncbi:MAG: MOSC domain-containing protein [bacterium]